MSLDAIDEAAAQRVLSAIRSAFESADSDALDVFLHPSQSKESNWYVADFIRNGRRISAARVEEYKQPDWEVFRINDLYPPPVFSIWVDLERTDRWLASTLFLPCGRSADGYCFCFYRRRGNDRQERS